MNILLCTLGASWPVIPEVLGFVDPDRFDLYRNHPGRGDLRRLRRDAAIAAPDELWVCTTEGSQADASLASLRRWWGLVGSPLPLRTWRAAGTDQLASQDECDHVRELILRLVLRATETAALGNPSGQVVLSLAGGRKTMSADLQWAGSLFGAHACLHIVSRGPLPEQIAQNAEPALFATSLAPALAGAILPLVIGASRRDELLDVDLDGGPVSAGRFPVPEADPVCLWAIPAQSASLAADINDRRRQGGQLFGNFLTSLAASERHENWRSLYRLPPVRIAELREKRLGSDTAADRRWLAALPKADLHRHLGGSLDLAGQRAVGAAIWEEMPAARRAVALDSVRRLLEGPVEWPWTWPIMLREGHPPRAECVAALLEHVADDILEYNLWGTTMPRIALKSRRGFDAYERPGELTGSAVLAHPAALEPYARSLAAAAADEGLTYVELRGSPQNYRSDDPAGFLEDLRAALARACATIEHAPEFRFIWILDRRQRHDMESIVRRAVDALERVPDFLVGLDLAGDEGTNRPEEIAPAFEPAFRACLPITIHAGEGESAANIWEAAYRLHADRIGHGLTLLEDPRLLVRFRERGICLEMCPTSNREVVGFRDPLDPDTANLRVYPVRELMDSGLAVTLSTDNPGISRTTVTGEILAASRMASAPFSRWDALAIIKQGFLHAFLPADRRERLLKSLDAAIFRQLIDH